MTWIWLRNSHWGPSISKYPSAFQSNASWESPLNKVPKMQSIHQTACVAKGDSAHHFRGCYSAAAPATPPCVHAQRLCPSRSVTSRFEGRGRSPSYWWLVIYECAVSILLNALVMTLLPGSDSRIWSFWPWSGLDLDRFSGHEQPLLCVRFDDGGEASSVRWACDHNPALHSPARA